jgi:3-oxoadipate enol-lactonase
VLIHSLLTGPEAFDTIAPALAVRHTVHRISLPGFGESAPLSNPSIPDIATHVAATLEALECGPGTSVLGNGLGGFVAAALAIGSGDRFGSLILSNSGASFSPERASAFGHMSRLVQESGMRAVVEVAVRRIFPERYLEANPSVIDERRRVLEAVDPGAFAAACRALATLDLRPQLGEIRNRTLVVAGAEDATTPPEMARELAAGIAGARLEVIPECGHCPQLQRPDALLAAVDSFMVPE